MDSELLGRFGRAYVEDPRSWLMQWFGRSCIQNPLDVWSIQQIIWDTRPDVVVETGTYVGGSAHLWAWLLAAAGGQQVITVDIDAIHDGSDGEVPISYVTGSSADLAVLDEVAGLVGGRRAMVILDSAHTSEHVATEIELFSRLVTPGCYLICQDTFIGGHPVVVHDLDPQHGPDGPWASVQQFVATHPDFEVDHQREPLFTFCTDGYLLRS